MIGRLVAKAHCPSMDAGQCLLILIINCDVNLAPHELKRTRRLSWVSRIRDVLDRLRKWTVEGTG